MVQHPSVDSLPTVKPYHLWPSGNRNRFFKPPLGYPITLPAGSVWRISQVGSMHLRVSCWWGKGCHSLIVTKLIPHISKVIKRLHMYRVEMCLELRCSWLEMFSSTWEWWHLHLLSKLFTKSQIFLWKKHNVPCVQCHNQTTMFFISKF